MTHGAHEAAATVLDAAKAWFFLGAWVLVVLVHGMWRSTGEVKQDPHRPSGPID